MAKSHSDIGLIGLAVMGQNLALNIADHGFRISVYNRTTEKTDKFVAENPNTPGGVIGTKTLEEFVQHAIMSSFQDPTFDHAWRVLAQITSAAIIEWLRRSGIFTLPPLKHRRSRRR